MPRLYELNDRLWELLCDENNELAYMASQDDYDADSAAWFEQCRASIGDQIGDQIGSCARAIKQLQADSKQLDEAASSLRARAKFRKNRAERMRSFVDSLVLSLPDGKYKDELVSCWMVRSSRVFDAEKVVLDPARNSYVEPQPPKILLREATAAFKESGVMPEGWADAFIPEDDRPKTVRIRI